VLNSRFDRIARWRRRADDYRTQADRCADMGARDAYETLAANCACLADAMEEQLPRGPGEFEFS